MMNRYLFFMVFIFILLSGCEQDINKAIPPDYVVNRVTDMYMMEDGKHFIFLSSNMNREYDYGRLVLIEIKEDGTSVFQDSVLVPSIAGKMSVTHDERTVYVTTRDLQGITRYKIIKKNESYKFDQIDSTDGYVPATLKTEKEPNAITVSPDGKRVLVTHIISGGLTVVDIDSWEKIGTYNLRKGVTSIIFDENSGYHVASHRESGLISVIHSIETVSRVIVDIAEVDLELPTAGHDIRSIKNSFDGTSIYGAFRNYSKSKTADTAPQLINFSINSQGKASAELLYTVPLRGALGEIAVMPYVTGEAENEVKGELVFISSPSERAVFIVDSIQKKVIDEIVFDKKCDPYQLNYKEIEKNKGLLFVSCFINDKIMMYDIDLSSPSFFKRKGVIE